MGHEHNHNHVYSAGNVPVDISYEALRYLGSLGYSRVKFVLSEMNHTTPDICDKVASRFQGKNFATLNSVLNKAPIFGNNPPAPIYGLTHPKCGCSYMVYPPATIAHLRLPGNPTKEQKREVLKHMYPQQVWALSRVPTIQDIDFSAFVDVTPERPVRKPEMDEYPWYQETWNWIKGKIFRKASDYFDFIRLAHTKIAANNVRLGDLVKFITPYDFTTEFNITTTFPESTIALALADHTDREIFVYVPLYDSVFPVRKDSLVNASNSDIPYDRLCKRVRVYNNSINDNIEGIIALERESSAFVYDFIEGKMVEIQNDELRFV